MYSAPGPDVADAQIPVDKLPRWDYCHVILITLRVRFTKPFVGFFWCILRLEFSFIKQLHQPENTVCLVHSAWQQWSVNLSSICICIWGRIVQIPGGDLRQQTSSDIIKQQHIWIFYMIKRKKMMGSLFVLIKHELNLCMLLEFKCNYFGVPMRR